MRALVVISHPNKDSFCYNGIYKEILKALEGRVEIKVADLYAERFVRPNDEMITRFKKRVTSTTHIYFISPVWWFRCTPRLEMFFDEVFTPGFAYEFKSISKLYGFPVPKLKDKSVRTYVTHGAPALPVLTIYANSVKLRLVMGVYTFVFGWRFSLWRKTKQFWSVPFVSNQKRLKYLERVKRDILKDLKE